MSQAGGFSFIPPCIPTLVEKPPEGVAWAHEIKYDGYRTQLHVGPLLRAYTRNGHDWSMKYASVLVAAGDLINRSAILDGEIVVQDENGRSDFKRLAGAIRWQGTNLVFFAFDLLALDGNDLRRERCEDRRQRLHELVGDPRPNSQIQFSQDFLGSGSEFFAAVEKMGLEGIVSKHRSSQYRSGPSKDWLKTKVYVTGEFVVLGYERNTGDAPSLLLAEVSDAGLRYVGRAIPTISGRQREELWEALGYLHVDRFEAEVGQGNKAAQPVRALLRVKARHLKGEEMLRHATVVDVLPPP